MLGLALVVAWLLIVRIVTAEPETTTAFATLPPAAPGPAAPIGIRRDTGRGRGRHGDLIAEGWSQPTALRAERLSGDCVRPERPRPASRSGWPWP